MVIDTLTRFSGYLAKRTVGLLLLGFYSVTLLANDFTATVDRTHVGVNETFQLTLRYDGQVFNEPDLSSLQKGFEIVNQQQSNQLSIVNGKRDSHTLWTLQLLAKQKGKLLIPSFNLNGSVSNAIEITVTDSGPKSGTDQLLFLETEVSKQDIYVQEQLLLTHRLFTRVNLNGLASDDLKIPGANLVKLSDNQFQKAINGVPHLVVETRYAVFPQNSGKLEIPSIRYSASIPDKRDPFSSSFFSRGGKKVYLRTEKKTITVNPRPASISMADWLPSKGVSLTEKWSRPTDQLKVGEPVTRTITVIAQGLTGAQLPPLELEVGDGYRVYPDQPQIGETTDTSGVIGTRTESRAIVPDRAGEITLPAVTVRWWDTEKNQIQETTIAQKTLAVQPATASGTTRPVETAATPIDPLSADPLSIDPTSPDSVSTTPVSSNHRLLYLLIALNLLLTLVIVILLVQLRKKQRTTTTPTDTATPDSEALLFRQVQKTAKQNPVDTDLLQRQLIAWARSFWPTARITTTEDIAAKADNPELLSLLRTLNSQRYGVTAKAAQLNQSTSQPNMAHILGLLEALRKHRAQQDKTTGNKLKNLYAT